MNDPRTWTKRLLMCSAGLAMSAVAIAAVPPPAGEPDGNEGAGEVASNNGLTFIAETNAADFGGSGQNGGGTPVEGGKQASSGDSPLSGRDDAAFPGANGQTVNPNEGQVRIPLQQIRDYNRAGLNCNSWLAQQDFIARLLELDAMGLGVPQPPIVGDGGVGEDIRSGGVPTRGGQRAAGGKSARGAEAFGKMSERERIEVTQGFAFRNFNYTSIPVPFGVDGPDVDLAREPVFPALAADNDGDGALDRVSNPFLNNPAIVFYAFLEPADLTVIFDEGIDNLNNIGAIDPTGMDDPMTAAENEALYDTDQLPEFWPAEPLPAGFVLRRHYIPSPGDILDFDIEPGVNQAIQALGLGPSLWPPQRPAFLGGTLSEAVWVFAQATRNRNVGAFAEVVDFTSTLDAGRTIPIGDPLRASVNAGIRIIELASNVKFLERPRARGTDVFGTPIPLPYPFEAMGDAYNSASTGLFPFGQAGGESADDYPWVLIMRTLDGEREATDGFGIRRGPVDIDYRYDDINGDGHPDFVDTNADFVPDAILLSAPGGPVSTAATGSNGLPLLPNMENAAQFIARAGAFGAAPIDVNGDGNPANDFVLPFLQFNNLVISAAGQPWQGNLLIDTNADLVPDAWDRNLDGVADDFDGVDTNGDGIPDGNGTADPIPLIITSPGVPANGQATYGGVLEPQPIVSIRMDTDSAVADALHFLMHALGFLHEQQRPDRDQFITVNFANITAAFITDYTIFDGTGDAQNLGATVRTDDYDFQSVMHFPPNRGSNGRGPTFTVRPEFQQFALTVGRGTGLSEGDVRTLGVLFGTNPSQPDPSAWFLGRDPTCPVDVDGDGSHTPADITAYRDLWVAQDPQADTVDADAIPEDIEPLVLTGQDGIVDFNDLQRFFNVLQVSGFGPCTGAGQPSSAENRARFFGTITLPQG